MKIGIDAKRYFFNQTGLGNHNRLVVNALIERYPQHTFYLFSPKPASHSSPNVKVITPTGMWKKLSSLWRVFSVAKQVEKLGVDIFLGPSNELPKGIHRFSKVHKVAILHDTIFFSHPEQYSFFDRRVHQLKAKYLKKAADRIVTVSEQTKADTIKYIGVSPEKVTVIYQDCHAQFKELPNVGTLERVKTTYALPDKYLLMVGRLEPRKNHERVIQALANLDKPIHLVIVGKSHKGTQARLKERIASLKLTERVTFFDKVPFADLPAIYHLSKTFVYPSLYEGFGIPILEALYQNTPVVTTEGGCFAEVGQSNVEYINPLDAQSIEQGICRALTEPKLIDKECLKVFDNEQLLAQYSDLLFETNQSRQEN